MKVTMELKFKLREIASLFVRFINTLNSSTIYIRILISSRYKGTIMEGRNSSYLFIVLRKFLQIGEGEGGFRAMTKEIFGKCYENGMMKRSPRGKC